MTFSEFREFFEEMERKIYIYELNYDIINLPQEKQQLRDEFKKILTSNTVIYDYVEHLGSGCMFISSEDRDTVEKFFKDEFSKLKKEFSSKIKGLDKLELVYSFDYIYQGHLFHYEGDNNKVKSWINKNKKYFLKIIRNG